MPRLQRTPNFFIVGAPKSGTTALFSYLEQHPDVFVPIEKEPHFFAPDMYEHTGLDYSLDRYLALFAPARDQARVGEASVWYLASRVAARNIGQRYPSAKIVASLRNPIEMVYALHCQTIYTGRHVVGDPTLPLAATRYEFVGRYAEQLERYFAVFGRDNVHVMVFDDLRRDVHEVHRRMLEFLEIRSDSVAQLRVINDFKQVRWRWLKRLTDRAPRPVSALLRALPRPTYRRLMQRVEAIHSRRAERPSMPPELRSYLGPRFAPEVERLSNLLGRDLTHWTRGA